MEIFLQLIVGVSTYNLKVYSSFHLGPLNALAAKDSFLYANFGNMLADILPQYIEWVRTLYGRPELSFSLKGKARVSLSLFNSTGQLAYEKDMGELGPGPHTIPIPGLKPGVYFLELRIDNRAIRRRIVFAQEGGFLAPEVRPGYLAPPPWEALGHMSEKPSREIHLLSSDLSCRGPAEIVLYNFQINRKFSPSPEPTDSLFRLAIVENVLNKGFFSWIPGLEPVLYTGKDVCAPGYYRAFYFEPPVIASSPWGADSVVLVGEGPGGEQGGYPYPVEDMSAPWATRGITPDKGLSRDFELRMERDGRSAANNGRPLA